MLIEEQPMDVFDNRAQKNGLLEGTTKLRITKDVTI